MHFFERQCGLTMYALFLHKLPITFLRTALPLRVLTPRDHCSVANLFSQDAAFLNFNVDGKETAPLSQKSLGVKLRPS